MLVAETGRVTPAPDGLHVEQVGWGVARQVARVLEEHLDPVPPLLAEVVRLAEVPGFLAYAVLDGPRALGVALVSLPGVVAGGAAAYVGDVLAAGAPHDVRRALLVRALHDVGSAGVPWLRADLPAEELRPLGFRPEGES